MIINLIIIFHVIFLIGVIEFYRISYKKFGYERYDLFNPINVIALFSLLAVPHMFLIAQDPAILYTSITHDKVNNLLIKYIYLHSLCIVLFIWAGNTAICSIVKKILSKFNWIKIKHSSRVVYIMVVLYLTVLIRNFTSLEISTTVLEIFYNRSDSATKIGYYFNIQQVLALFILFLFLKNRNKLSFFKLKFIAFSIIALLGSLLLGGRTQFLYILIFNVFTYTTLTSKEVGIRFFLKSRIVVPFILTLIMLLVIPSLRTPTNVEQGVENLNISEEYSSNIETVLADMSGLDRYLFVIEWFDEYGYWWGKGYLDLIPSLIPRSWAPDKPPGDDGLYLNLMSNDKKYIVPPLKPDDFYKTSYPPGNYAAYMNFGPLGLLLGYIFLGALVKAFYDGANQKKFRFVYCYNMFLCGSIGLSNLSILNLLLNLAALFAVYLLYIFFIKIFV